MLLVQCPPVKLYFDVLIRNILTATVYRSSMRVCRVSFPSITSLEKKKKKEKSEKKKKKRSGKQQFYKSPLFKYLQLIDSTISAAALLCVL